MGLEDFLYNQTQKLVVSGEESLSVLVISGVLQGEVLGPLLFLIYINNMPYSVSHQLAYLLMVLIDIAESETHLIANNF